MNSILPTLAAIAPSDWLWVVLVALIAGYSYWRERAYQHRQASPFDSRRHWR